MSHQLKSPVLFLDVDGVLNSSSDGCPWPDQESTIVKHPEISMGLKIIHSKALGRALKNLEIEIRWLTTWGTYANKLISPLYDLPDNLKVQAIPEDYITLNTDIGIYLSTVQLDWKLQAVQDFVAKESRPFIWIDDEAIAGNEEKLADIADGIPYLEIQPLDEIGLMQVDINRIAQFIGSLG